MATDGSAGGYEPLVIDCSVCVRQHTDTCEDCMVTYLCTRDTGDAVIIDVAEVRAIRALADVGLVPHLRHRRRAGTA
jgi:hypothetical protein